jgi:hypothetical protein
VVRRYVETGLSQDAPESVRGCSGGDSLSSSASHEVLGMLRDRLVRVALDCESQLEHLYDLAGRFADRSPDLADLCVIRMSEWHPQHPVLTVDEAVFFVYRRNQREAIPLLCPPKKK